MHTTPRPLQVHNGGANDRSDPRAEQLRLGEGPNDPQMLRRLRQAMQVAARGGRPPTELAVFAVLATYARRDGIAPVGAEQLARDLERTYTNVCRAIRGLAADGLVQPLADHRGRGGRKGYRVPLMVAPLAPVDRPGR